MKKVYYKMILKQTSPLRIGNSISEQSDSDLMLDGRGLPFVPGTSIAGIVRHMAEDENNYPKEVLEHLFGTINVSGKNSDDGTKLDHISSTIIFGDAILPMGLSANDKMISRRDGIKLDDWGITIRKAKYDFQIAEVDNEYISVIEWDGDEKTYKAEIEDIIEPILIKIASEGLKAGARTSRGFGAFEVKIYKKVFEFPDDIQNWLEFNPYEADFSDEEKIEGTSEATDNIIDIAFEMKSNFSIRVNTARTELESDGSIPDSVPLENAKGNPVISGTVWAGVFRHHMHELLRDAGYNETSDMFTKVDECFGVFDNLKTHRKSFIYFSESDISIKNKEIQKMSVVRTAIDRFTSSPRNAALFTDMVYSGGTGVLRISFKKNKLSNDLLELLAACICDMHLGIISIGGAVSVGRGIMSITGLKFNGNEIFDKLNASIENGESLNWLKEEQINE